jgi:hypothetical protein
MICSTAYSNFSFLNGSDESVWWVTRYRKNSPSVLSSGTISDLALRFEATGSDTERR